MKMNKKKCGTEIVTLFRNLARWQDILQFVMHQMPQIVAVRACIKFLQLKKKENVEMSDIIIYLVTIWNYMCVY